MSSSSSSSAVAWSDTHETPNLKTQQIVFTSGSTVTIQAPAEKVFDIILAFDKYGDWNPGCPKFEFKEGDEIAVDAIGILHVRMEAQKRDYEIPAKILRLDSTPQKHTLAWRGMLLPTWAGITERVQEVTPSEDGTACTVKQWESMVGWVTYVFKYIMGIPKQLDESNVKYLNALKAYAEASQSNG